MIKMLSPLFAVTLLFQTFSFSQSSIEAIRNELENNIKAECIDKELPAFSIVLVNQSEVVMEAHYGSKTVENKNDLVDSNTIFRTGSVGKTITDLAVLMAVDQNLLDLDADVRSYLPDFTPSNAYKTPITLRHLIKHQSGLVREPPLGNYFDDSNPTLEETVNSLNNTSLLWEPGTKTKYSNSGLAVVGRILEKTYGMDYGTLLDALIFKPLAMQNSRVGFDAAMEKNLARGYMWFPGQETWMAPLFDLGMKPAGDLYISMEDMAALIMGFLNPDRRLISNNGFEQMWKPSPTSTNWRMDVGLGFSLLGDFNGEYQMARHGGAVYGYSTELAILPKEDLGVYAVATKDMSGTAKAITHWLLKAVLAARNGLGIPPYELEKKPFLNLPSELEALSGVGDEPELDQLVGTYGKPYNPLKIYQHNGKLYALIEWFFLYPLTRESDTIYRFPSWSLYKGESIEFLFSKGKKAAMAQLGNGKAGIVFLRIN